MSTPAGIVAKMLAGGATEAVSFAAGVAIAPTLAPVLQALENETWSLHPDKPPAALVLASGVAQGQVDETVAREWAKETGFGDAAMSALIDIANTGPALGLAYSAWRRGELTDAEFDTALKRTGLEDQWFAALRALKDVLLDPAQIATAVHRNIMRDSSLIVREPPTTPGKVPQVPESTLDPAHEAAGSGIDHERLRVLVGITGLPPGLVQMLQLLNRGEVTEDDVRRAVAQSNLRNEYMDVVLALRRRLLTPHEYEEAALRGILTRAEADAGAALSGMEAGDAGLLFEIMGRPLTVHQLVTGLARGGTFGGTYADVPEPYRDAIRRSNIRPEYAKLAYANRYTYPSAFVLRGLAQAGELGDAAAVEQILLEIGWPPSLAAKVAPSWVGGAATGDTHVSKAQTQLWTATHKAYVNDRIDAAAATTALGSAGVAAGSVAAVLATWNAERDLIRGGLSAANIKKAYREATFTVDEAVARLVELGWSVADANTYLSL